MIRLMGLEIRDDENPDGDIEINYVGLREGEKLYEELLIGENTSGTEHPRIMRNEENFLTMSDLRVELKKLSAAMDAGDGKEIRKLLEKTVEGYRPEELGGPGKIPEHVSKTVWSSPERIVH